MYAIIANKTAFFFNTLTYVSAQVKHATFKKHLYFLKTVQYLAFWLLIVSIITVSNCNLVDLIYTFYFKYAPIDKLKLIKNLIIWK